MKYLQFFDHLAIAYAAYQTGNAESANIAIQAAFDSRDAQTAVTVMLDHNERAVTAASDTGVEFDTPGEEQRVMPNEKTGRPAPPSADLDVTPAPDACCEDTIPPAVVIPVTASRRKERFFASMK